MPTPPKESSLEPTSASQSEGNRSLGPLTAMSLVAGTMLGIGIFIAPPDVARHIDHPITFVLMWALGGVSALCGALCVAELGAMMPRAGGDYPYLRLAYGPGVAFAAGWLQLLAIFPGSLATMAVGTASYQLPVVLGSWYPIGDMLGLVDMNPTLWAVIIIVGFTALNHVGVVLSGMLQVLFTVVPLGVLLLASLWVLGGGTETDGLTVTTAPSLPALGGAAAAFLSVYFAYSGWNAAIFVGGEIRDPVRNVPRSLVGGTLSVTVLYLLLCLGFLAVLGIDDLATAGEAGSAVARRLFGATGEMTITVLIVLAMLGSINGCVLTGSRIGYAMAEHGDFTRTAATLHRRWGTPVVALWVQAAIGVLLVATHSFEHLIKYTSAAMLVTGTLTVMAVVILRRRLPDLPRPYKAWGYPVTPILYAASSVFVLGVFAVRIFEDGAERDWSVLLAVVWFVVALAVHRLRHRGSAAM
jgi:APA family basic amino acid/polyamine antiporter